MPTITIYLKNDLYDKVRDAPSKTVSTALQHYFKNEGDELTKAPEGPPQLMKEESKDKHGPTKSQ